MPKLARVVWSIALAKLVLHLATSARGYGYFGDELYYMACADRLAWGYVDHPPLSIALLSLWQGYLGESLAALRLLSAIFGAGAVVAVGALARELGGRDRAQGIAAIVVALAPVNLVVHGFYSMNSIDILVWELAFVAIARLVHDPSPGRWLGLGALLGLGLLNKLSVAWLGAGFLLGLLTTRHRRLLLSAWPWLAGSIAGMIFAPHVLWQAANGFPTAEFVQAATSRKMVPVGPVDLFAQQALVMGPAALPIWLVGLVLLFRGRGTGPERVFGVIFVTTSAILIANGTSRPNYLALAQPPLVAAGAIGIERLSVRTRWRRLPVAAATMLGVVGLLATPLTLPVLPVDLLVRATRGADLVPRMEDREIGAIGPHFADMVGWDAIVDAVAEVYDGLPAEERARAGIIGPSYSETAAIERLGRARGLPVPASPHNAYWHWGPGTRDGSVVVIAGGPRSLWSEHWAELEEAGTWDCGHCLPGRNHQTIFVAREPRAPIETIWNALRHYD